MKAFKRKNDSLLFPLRKQLGLSQEQMAGHIGMGYTAYKMAEQGRRPVPVAVLMQVTGLELKLKEQVEQPVSGKPHPLEARFITRYRRDFQWLFTRELVRRKQVLSLQLRLEQLQCHYKKCREWLAVLDDAAKEPANDGCAAHHWKKQQQAAIKKLERCAMPVQLLLKLRIELLVAEANLYRSMQEKLRKELPEFFSGGEQVAGRK
jgi:transcriptional regulator with XRE-family HTH domain